MFYNIKMEFGLWKTYEITFKKKNTLTRRSASGNLIFKFDLDHVENS